MRILNFLAHSTAVLAIGYQSRPDDRNSTATPYAVGYAALTDEGLCKTEQRVLEDLQDISIQGGVQVVSIEGITCDQHELVARLAHGLGMKVHVAFPISDRGLEPTTLQMQLFVDSLNEKPYWKSIEAVIVGNSAIKNNHVGWMDLENLTWRLKSALKSAGYTGQISISEPAETFESFPILCRSDTIDFVSIEFWPFYHPQNSHRESGMMLTREIMRAQHACAKSVYVSSAGYPSSATTNGNQIASRDRQEQAINMMLTSTGGNLTLQTYFNEPWRNDGQFNDLQYYGMRKVIQGGYD